MTEFAESPLNLPIHQFLADNLHLVMGHGAEIVQRDAQVSFGQIDLLCRCSRGDVVAVEVCSGVANREAIGQLLAFIGELRRQGLNAHVRGILVAEGLDPAAEAALYATNDIEYYAYETRYAFHREFASGSSRAPTLPPGFGLPVGAPVPTHMPAPVQSPVQASGHAPLHGYVPAAHGGMHGQSMRPMPIASPVASPLPANGAAAMTMALNAGHHAASTGSTDGNRMAGPRQGASASGEPSSWGHRPGRFPSATGGQVGAGKAMVRYCPHCRQETGMQDFHTRFRCESCGNYS